MTIGGDPMKQLLPFILLISMICCAPAKSDPGNSTKIKNDEPKKLVKQQKLKKIDYTKKWQEVQKQQSNNLPKTALKLTKEIYKYAQEQKNHPQMIKALLFKLNYIQRVEENTFVKVQKILNEGTKSPEPYQQLLHSMIAQQYWSYYQSNRWKFLKRSKTAQVKLEDMRTWSLDKIVEEINKHYIASLKNPELLKKTDVTILKELLYNQKNNRVFRPTLYDFLAHRAIDFYMGHESRLTRPSYYFTLNKAQYLGTIEQFTALKLETKDLDSFQFKGLKLIQNLMIAHIDDKSPNALIDLNLKRLKLVYQKGIIPNKTKIYEENLKNLLEKHQKSPKISSDIKYELAILYNNLGDGYVPEHAEHLKWLKKRGYTLCQEIIKDTPKTFAANRCQYSLFRTIEKKQLNITAEQVITPEKPFKILVSRRNIKKLYLNLYKTDMKQYQAYRYRYHGLIDHFKEKKPFFTHTITLPDDGDYQTHKIESIIPGLKSGKYVAIFSNNKHFNTQKDAMAYQIFNVSNLAYTTRNFNDQGKMEFSLYHRTTGNSVSGGIVQTYYSKYDHKAKKYILTKGRKYQTDQKGYVLMKRNNQSNSFYISVKKGEDTLFLDGTHYLSNYGRRDTYEKTFFFTDRKIYRPGQTVYFKGIVLNHNNKHGEKTKLLIDRNKEITLLDVNGQKVATLNLKTNQFGTLSGQFQLPMNLLKGQFQIYDGNRSRHYFSVEAYKRPKFEVKYPKQNKLYRLNDEISVTGKAMAYAGFPIDQGKVVYRVVRTTYYPFRGYYWFYTPPSPSIEITNGTTVTDEKGQFKVTFKTIPDLSVAKKYNPAFRYTIYADVTDLNGETRSASKTLSVGYQALMIGIIRDHKPGNWQFDQRVKKERITINTTNLSGEFVPTKGDFTITKLITPKRILKKKIFSKPDQQRLTKAQSLKQFPNDIYQNEDRYDQWETGKIVLSQKFNTQKQKQFTLNTKKWTPGIYTLNIKAKDDRNEVVEKIQYVTIYNPTHKKLHKVTPHWFTAIKNKCEPGENALFLIGTSYKNQYIQYEIEHKGNIIARKKIRLNNEQRFIKIPVQERYRGNFSVHFTMIRDGRLYQNTPTIQVPWSNKKLKIAFETFRDKLQPGEKEQWKLKLTGPKGEKIAAEMVATLYDASLDLFKPNSWYFSIFPHLYAQRALSGKGFSTQTTQNIGFFGHHPSHSKRSYDQLNWFGFRWYQYYKTYRRSKRMLFSKRQRAMPSVSKSEKSEELLGDDSERIMELASVRRKTIQKPIMIKRDQAKDEPTIQSMDPEKKNRQETQNEHLNSVKVRTNFNETAFFYPHLTTDKNGIITINFTIPESLTKWKMLGFAHTKDLKSDTVLNELVTQKNLMVLPNAPRFLRENDTIEFTSKITNLTAQKLTGDVKLMLFDAITMKPVDHLFKLKNGLQKFTTKSKGSTLVKWQLSVPETVDAVKYRIVAKSGNFSDGEEMALPILKNRMLVTESLPLPVRALQTKKFSFDKLINSGKSTTLKHHKLTLEFTSNPVWYAVQAIPYMMEYPYECMEQTFTRYYGNSLASYVVNKIPRIKSVFEQWQRDPKQKALTSNLEKNQELKSLLLKETPWVLDGQDESARKKRVALLFNLTRIAGELERALKKLDQGQLPSGGWPWFQGGRENRYITQHIVAGFAHLKHLNVVDTMKNKTIKKMVSEAVPYLDRKIRDDYQRLLDYKTNLKSNNLSYIHFHYFYARSYFKDQITLDSSIKPQFDYYFNQLKKYWKGYNKYTQGMIALTMNRYGEQKLAKEIMISIKEHALHSEEMGTYWKESYGYHWYQAPIETQALLIEAFDEILEDHKMVEGMKTWLIKSKQTQNWRTTKATADAIYALLLKGENWLTENKSALITMGDLKIDPDKMKDLNVEAGTGYFKTSWSQGEIKPEMGKVIVHNRNKVVAWGAVYWQYFEQLDKITAAETPLKLKKQLFVQRSSDKGPVLHPVTKEDVKIGDRIKVRIELRVDRDMEYIHMKDMRASSFEPENVISKYKWQDGLGYYQSTGDGSTSFFIDFLPKGTYVFEYPLRVTHKGDFSNGITTIQSMYAPEFSSHSEGIRVQIQ